MSWYAVERRYRVADVVYVEARTAEDAKQKVRDVDYEYLTDPEAIDGRCSLSAKRRTGVPRWMWEEMGYPDDVAIDG